MHVASGLNSLQGREAGKHCLIVGGGPSAAEYHGPDGKTLPDCDFQIVINGAIQQWLPDYWLMLDYDSPRPDWFDLGYFTCQNHSNTTAILSHVTREEYPDAIHAKVSTEEPDLRSARLGLKMCPAETGTRLVGTSALCALHLAGILGASKVSMIGVDLCFKQQPDGTLQHHPYECRNYGEHATTSGAEMEPRAYGFDVQYGEKQDGVPQKMFIGRLVWSCPWFYASSKRIREYMTFAAANGMDCEDYSGGLLSVG